jgi:hypothetical protein
VIEHFEKRLDFLVFRAPHAESSPSKPTEGGCAMDQFITDQFVECQNIAHYVGQLKTENDPIKRAMLQQLLAEETTKQASHAKVVK